MKIWKTNMDRTFNVEHDFSEFKRVFSEQNSMLNLVSKNDEKYLYEKHIYDSLAIKLANRIESGKTLLDIGCGGGFPCIPIAIEYPGVNVVGIDSIRKKINAVNFIKEKLNIENFSAICDRAENLKGQKYDIITSRAVAELSVISGYALPLLKKDGIFVAYKSKKAIEEIKSAEKVLSQNKAKVLDIIEYTLPLDEVYERNLIIIGF